MIILEGPDGGGKTTVSETVHQLLPEARLVRHGPYKEDRDLFPRFLASLLANPRGNLILDRSWLSEPIYGRAWREGEDRVGNVSRRMLERVAMGRDAFVVNCCPSLDTILGTWGGRVADEYVKTAEAMKVVFEGYQRLGTELPIWHYNRDEHSPEDLSQWIVERTMLPATGQLRNGRIGNWHSPRVILLGERSNAKYDLPFVAGSGNGCSRWLTGLLEEAEIPESQLAWMNVQSPNGQFKDRDFSVRPGQTVVALGRVAAAWCEHQRVPFRMVQHPQYWKRFRHGQTYPLLDVLTEVL